MAICMLDFAESDRGAMRWYCRNIGEPYSFIDDFDEAFSDKTCTTVVIKEDGLDSECLKTIKKRAYSDKYHKYIFFSNKDIEAQYMDMMEQRELAMRVVCNWISPSVFFEYHIASCQFNGYIITGVDESEDGMERYVTAFHPDSRRTLFIAFSMDGHFISKAVIEERGKGAFDKRYAEYSEHSCESIVENIRLEEAFDNIDSLPVELANIRSEADKALFPFDGYYYGDPAPV